MFTVRVWKFLAILCLLLTGTLQAEDKAVSSAPVPSLMEIEGKVQELAAKIKSRKAHLQTMFEEKNKLKDNSPELKVKIQEILKTHADLRKWSEEYEKQLHILKYRYPERNSKALKKREDFEIKSVIEMEQAMTVDGKLDRNLKKMRSQYGLEGPEPKVPSKESEASPGKPLPAKTPGGSIEDSDVILMQK